MNNYIQLYQIYYSTLIKILNNYPNSEIGVRWLNDNEYIYDVRIPELDDQNKIRVLIANNTNKNDFVLKNENISIDDYISKLNGLKQSKHLNLIDEYLLYDIYSLTNKDDLYYINGIKQKFSILSNFQKDFYNNHLLDDIQYSFYKFISLTINLKKYLETGANQKTYWHETNMCLTLLFISLAGIIKNLHMKDSRMKQIINSIKIDSYERYKRNKKVIVNSIDDLIVHFRDAVCHLENKNNKITERIKGGDIRLFISRVGEEATITYGDGKLIIKNHLIPLIKGIKKLFIPEKISVVSINKNEKTLFCDLANLDEDFPLKGNIKVTKIQNGLFRIHFPINF